MDNGIKNSENDRISIHDPKNILWQLFRMQAEEICVPEIISHRVSAAIAANFNGGET